MSDDDDKDKKLPAWAILLIIIAWAVVCIALVFGLWSIAARKLQKEESSRKLALPRGRFGNLMERD